MVAHLFRDSTMGVVLNSLSHGRLFPHPEQLEGFVLPERYHARAGADVKRTLSSGAVTLCGDMPALNPTLDDSAICTQVPSPTFALGDKSSPGEKGDYELEEKRNALTAERLGLELQKVVIEERNPFLIDWDGEFDQDNPRNWSLPKRRFVAFLVALLTFSIYIGSAIYTSSIPGLISSFDISLTVATLGLTLFVFAYGCGPMVLAPLQEMARIGRNPVYIIGLALFVLFQMPPLLAPNIETILVFRFLAGFVGSPALATGGASMSDLFDERALPAYLAIWSLGAVSGPVLGPVIGGFSAQANGWRWPFFELLWLSGFTLIVLTVTFPETYGPTILLRRAVRIRKVTGDDRYQTQTEMDLKPGETPFQEAKANFFNAFLIAAEPAVFFANAYIGIIYALFYLWFEAFPLVFTEIYGFSLGISGLPYLGFLVTGILSYIIFVWYNNAILQPRLDAVPAPPPEIRLELALYGSVFIPISLLIFGWGARADVTWFVPVLGAALYLPGIYIIFQVLLLYTAMAYPKYAASVLAGNDLFRSTFASFFPLFGAPFFLKLGLGPACTLLAGISTLLIPVLWLLMKYGARLRARSKFTSNLNEK